MAASRLQLRMGLWRVIYFPKSGVDEGRHWLEKVLALEWEQKIGPSTDVFYTQIKSSYHVYLQ
jgi:hypothetical protein